MAPRHYTILKRLLNQQRISRSACWLQAVAALREASLESPLGNGLRAWFSAVSHGTKGCWDPCVFTGSSHCCLAQGCGHTGPETGTRKATGPSLQADGTNHLLPAGWGGRRALMGLPEDHPQGHTRGPGVGGGGLQATPKLWTLLPLLCFYNHTGRPAGQHRTLWAGAACSWKTQ